MLGSEEAKSDGRATPRKRKLKDVIGFMVGDSLTESSPFFKKRCDKRRDHFILTQQAIDLCEYSEKVDEFRETLDCIPHCTEDEKWCAASEILGCLVTDSDISIPASSIKKINNVKKTESSDMNDDEIDWLSLWKQGIQTDEITEEKEENISSDDKPSICGVCLQSVDSWSGKIDSFVSCVQCGLKTHQICYSMTKEGLCHLCVASATHDIQPHFTRCVLCDKCDNDLIPMLKDRRNGIPISLAWLSNADRTRFYHAFCARFLEETDHCVLTKNGDIRTLRDDSLPTKRKSPFSASNTHNNHSNNVNRSVLPITLSPTFGDDNSVLKTEAQISYDSNTLKQSSSMQNRRSDHCALCPGRGGITISCAIDGCDTKMHPICALIHDRRLVVRVTASSSYLFCEKHHPHHNPMDYDMPDTPSPSVGAESPPSRKKIASKTCRPRSSVMAYSPETYYDSSDNDLVNFPSMKSKPVRGRPPKNRNSGVKKTGPGAAGSTTKTHNKKFQCPFCLKFFCKFGIGSHKRFCREKLIKQSQTVI